MTSEKYQEKYTKLLICLKIQLINSLTYLTNKLPTYAHMIYVLSPQAFCIKTPFVSRIAKTFSPLYTCTLYRYYFICTIRSNVLMKYMFIHNVLCTNDLNIHKGILPCLGNYLKESSIYKENGGYRLLFTITCTRWSVASVPYRLQNLNAAPTQTKLV